MITDFESEFLRVQRVEIASWRHTPLLELDWDCSDLTLSDDARFLAFTANEDGVSRLHVFDLNTR